RTSRSLSPDIVRLDYFAPLLGVFSDEFAKIVRRHRFWNTADFRKSRVYLGIREGRIDFFVKLADYFGGRVFWCDHAIPHACLIARYKLIDGRDVWKRLRTCPAGHRKGAQLACPDVLDCGGYG